MSSDRGPGLVTQRADLEDVYPLAPMQRVMLLQSLAQRRSGVYIQQKVCELRERIDESALERAWRHVVERHAVLRTAFELDGPGESAQQVHRQASLPWQSLDWRSSAPAEQQRRFDAFVEADRHRDFDLRAPPLLRLAFFRLGEHHSRLLVTYHHALLDGRSRGALLREAFDACDAFSVGGDVAFPSARPYRDFIDWLARRDAESARRHWQETMAGFVAPTSLIGVLRRPESPATGPNYAFHEVQLTHDSTQALTAFAHDAGVTLNTLVVAAWGELLSRYTGETDVTFGVTLSLRGGDGEAFADTVGLLVNSVPVRLRVDPDRRLHDWLQDVRAQWRAMRPHAWASLADIRTWAGTSDASALFTSLVAFEHAPVAARLRAARPQWSSRRFVYHGAPMHPLTLIAFGAPVLSLRIVHDRALFDSAAVAAMLGHLRTLIEGIVAESDRPLRERRMLPEDERQRVIFGWNATARRFESLDCVHRLIERQTANAPEAIAVEAGGRGLTYRELDQRANGLARQLTREGFPRGSLVGVCTERGPELVVAMLGALKAGGAFLPIDPASPPERIARIAGDAELAAMVVTPRTRTRTGAAAGRIIVLDDRADPAAPRFDDTPAVDVGLDDLAYAVYTSGSTGEPKGIAVTHRALANHTLALIERYGVDCSDRRLQFVSIGSDVLVAEVFPVLVAGGTLVLRPDEGMLSIADFLRFVEARRITITGLPSAYWHEWVAAMDSAPLPASLRLVVSGMDSVRADRFAIWKRMAKGRLRWFNAYGPSEATCTAASYEADVAADTTPDVVPIGRPLPNVRIYLLDALLRPVAPGLPGEICIAGAGVARGYLHRPDLTAEKFVRDPFDADPAARLYRSGDLGRHLSDGNIEFLGRLDNQVKIRGHRVEPREIEKALIALPQVRDACVVAHGKPGATRRLAAYVVIENGHQASPADLRAALRRTLPDPMVPAEFVALPVLPLTPSGKVDLRALPEPAPTAPAPAGAAPRSALESRVAALWAARLPRPAGIHDRFLDAGGDSLTGLQVLAAIQTEFGVEIPPDALFDDTATIAGMAERIAVARAGGIARLPPTIPRRAPGAPVPLSAHQAAAWFLQRLDPTGIAYNEPRLWEIDGEIDLEILRGALAAVAAHQPMLRTRFPVVDGHPQQVIDAAPVTDLEIVDLANAGQHAASDAAAAVRERVNRRLDLAATPPSRWTLLRLAPARSLLLRVSHHITGDALSAQILARELSQAYSALRSGRDPEFAPLAVDYADFAVWQATQPQEVRERSTAFWKACLAGLPVLALSADFVRPAAQSFRGAIVTSTLVREDAQALRTIGRAHRATAFACWLAAFSALLARLCGDTDLAIGTPVAARSLPEVAPIVGFFANTVVFRADLSGAPSTHELLERTRERLAAILAHQDLPFERVVEALGVPRDPSRNPLFQVAFAARTDGGDGLRLDGTHCRAVSVGIERSKFDLAVSVVERDDRVDVHWEYCSDLFRRETIERMSRQFAQLVAAMGRKPDEPVATLPLMDEATEKRVLAQAFGAANPYPAASTIDVRFAEQARLRPAAPAAGALDYGHLDAAANRMARELRRRGARPGSVVAIARRAASDIAVAWLGALKAGAAYLPIDPEQPSERISRMLADARATIAIADDAFEAAFTRLGVSVLCPQRDAAAIERHTAEALDAGTGPEDAAYVMYTSGSTGAAKGVVVPHRAVLRLVCGTDCAQIGPDDTLAQLANPAFDASTFEFWGALLNGARLVGIPRTTALAPRALAAALANERVTVLFLTTALFNTVAREVPEAFRACRCVLFGGEAVEPRWVAAVLRAGAPRELLHVYGPTETTTFATCHEVRDVPAHAATIRIGRPLANTEAFVLRDDGELAAPGEPGEIWIGGPGLATGYCNAPREDSDRFVERRIATLPARRLYRTGDLARLDDDGAIEFLGRRDRQVKLRGHRIELEEIEAAIARLPQVRAAAVALQGETSDSRQLVAWVVAADESGPPPGDLRRELRRALPDYMLPSSIAWVKALPLNASGKLDRRALPSVAALAGASPGERVAPRDMLEQMLVGIWERALGRSGIGVLDRFFEIGGHSLLAAELFDAIERETGVALPLASLFADDTIAGLAGALRESRSELDPPVVAVNGGGRRPPLVFLHGDLSGGGFYSRALARALGPEQPVLVVQPHGLDNAPIPETIEVMASDRVRALRAVQPRGPYLLGGYCNGAYVAFEMARQLAAEREPVPLLVVIEAVAPRAEGGAAPAGHYVTVDRTGVRKLEARDRAKEAQLRYSQAMDRYAGGPYGGRFLLLRTREGNDPRRDLGWARLVRRIELAVLPGDHVTLVTRNVDALARAIGSAIGHTTAAEEGVHGR